jgi:DNA-directed RNA polymerase specialized sigma24 family protein
MCQGCAFDNIKGHFLSRCQLFQRSGYIQSNPSKPGTMNKAESRAFLKGEMAFTPQRMMRYIRSRARLATDEDIEDILQNALILVTQHFDPSHPDANLALYCLGACNKAIAQNLERYHKVVLKKREQPAEKAERKARTATPVHVGEAVVDGQVVTVKTLASEKGFSEEPGTSSQFRTTSLDSMFDEDDGRNPEDIFGWEYNFLSGDRSGRDPASTALMNDLVEQVLCDLPPGIHRTCFLLKYVEGYKREDLISCLKMEPKSIDTIDKKIVRTLKAFKEKLERDDLSI